MAKRPQIIAANQALVDRLPAVRGSYRPNALLSKTNWFQVGGPAEVLYRPADSQDLSDFLSEKPEDVPVTVLGVGSNTLVRDGGIKGVVIKLGRGFTEINCQDDELTAGAGALSFNVATAAKEHHLTGLEFLIGVPGSIGGALAMNAGAYNGDVAGVLKTAELIDEQGGLHHVSVSDIGYIYRGNTLPDGMIFTKATFKGTKGDRKEIAAKMEQITTQRQATQPIKERTSGSTFKNPPGHKAWQLIDQAGCRGLKKGGAQVSEQHCNFFINSENATAKDIEQLGAEVRAKVKENSGVELEWEVKIIGEENVSKGTIWHPAITTKQRSTPEQAKKNCLESQCQSV